MSSLTKINLLETGRVNELLEKTCLCIMIQGGHQSDPVNCASTYFLFFLADASALSRFVVQLLALA